MNLKNRSFLKLLDFTPEEIKAFIDLAIELKAKKSEITCILLKNESLKAPEIEV